MGDDIFNWEIIVIGPPETLYEGNKQIFCHNLINFIWDQNAKTNFRRLF